MKTMRPITNTIMMIKSPIKRFLTRTDNIASAKYAMSKVPIIAPIDIAKKVFKGFIPINLPTIDPTIPPEP